MLNWHFPARARQRYRCLRHRPSTWLENDKYNPTLNSVSTSPAASKLISHSLGRRFLKEQTNVKETLTENSSNAYTVFLVPLTNTTARGRSYRESGLIVLFYLMTFKIHPACLAYNTANCRYRLSSRGVFGISDDGCPSMWSLKPRKASQLLIPKCWQKESKATFSGP